MNTVLFVNATIGFSENLFLVVELEVFGVEDLCCFTCEHLQGLYNFIQMHLILQEKKGPLNGLKVAISEFRLSHVNAYSHLIITRLLKSCDICKIIRFLGEKCISRLADLFTNKDKQVSFIIIRYIVNIIIWPLIGQ